MSNKIHKTVNDIGQAAYLKMNGWPVVGRKGKAFYFEVNSDEENNFDKQSFDFINSVFHQFDSNLMSLKKMPDYDRRNCSN